MPHRLDALLGPPKVCYELLARLPEAALVIGDRLCRGPHHLADAVLNASMRMIVQGSVGMTHSLTAWCNTTSGKVAAYPALSFRGAKILARSERSLMVWYLCLDTSGYVDQPIDGFPPDLSLGHSPQI